MYIVLKSKTSKRYYSVKKRDWVDNPLEATLFRPWNILRFFWLIYLSKNTLEVITFSKVLGLKTKLDNTMRIVK